MQATRPDVPCLAFSGTERRYQERASFELGLAGRMPALWSWIVADCSTPNCIEVEHLRVHAPLRLAYPYGICVYCGRHAATKDHLLPRNWTGDSQRHFVVTVPACGTCNSTLRDTITTSITERRALCHTRLRRHFRKTLRTVELGESDLAEYGADLRSYLVSEMDRKREVLRMLAWPEDPAYDMRAVQQSGIENPFVIGLIVSDDDPEMWRRVREIA